MALISFVGFFSVGFVLFVFLGFFCSRRDLGAILKNTF